MKQKIPEITFDVEFEDVCIEKNIVDITPDDKQKLSKDLPSFRRYGDSDNRQIRIISVCSLCKYSLFPRTFTEDNNIPPNNGFCNLHTRRKFKENKKVLIYDVSKKNFLRARKYAKENWVRINVFTSCEHFVFDPNKIKFMKKWLYQEPEKIKQNTLEE